MRSIPVRRVVTVIGLVAGWCALWGSFSAANVLSGTVLATLLVVAGMGSSDTGGLRLVPLARFLGLVAVDLVRSTISVAREILTPTDYTDESIVAVELPAESRRHLLLLVVAVTVTPGTAVVDTDPDTGTLYLHLLHHDRVDSIVDHVVELADLACAALPVESKHHRSGAQGGAT